MRRGSLTLCALIAFGLSSSMHAAETPVPGAGTLLQELKPVEPPAPSAPGAALTIEPPVRADLPQTAPFPISTIEIFGNTSFDTATLHALVADAEGHELTLPELDARVARISNFYRARGFPLARALIPAQTISAGVVKVEVLEARYGQTLLENHSRVSDALLKATLSPLANGRLIEQSALDRVILLLSDIPGVVPTASLQAGQTAGTSDLRIETAPTPRVAGVLTVDNDGNRFTGGVRGGAELALYDPLHRGDVLDANVLSSGRDLNYGRLSYDVLLNGEGTHLGGSFSALHYFLGEALSSLEGHGTAQVASAWLKQPLVRTQNLNIYAQAQFDRKELRDHIDVSEIHTDRHLDNGTVGFSADWRDGVFSGGANSASLQWVRGAVGFDDATAEHADAATARIRGNFSQFNATLARLQRLSAQDTLYLTGSGQWASGNLDPSQQMVAGGRYTVRSYDMSVLSGDTGEQASAELRHDLKSTAYGQWQATAFLEAEHLTIDKNVWTAGANTATLRGAGVGVNWANAHRWSAKASVATRLGAAPALVGSASRVRGWLEISKAF